jgi:hypothetical protein
MQSSCWMVGTYGEEMMVDDHCPHSKCVTFVGPSVGNSWAWNSSIHGFLRFFWASQIVGGKACKCAKKKGMCPFHPISCCPRRCRNIPRPTFSSWARFSSIAGWACTSPQDKLVWKASIKPLRYTAKRSQISMRIWITFYARKNIKVQYHHCKTICGYSIFIATA